MSYTNWGSMEPREPYTKCSPRLVALLKYLVFCFGGQTLGCYGVRKKRGGKSWSAHAHGAAIDWRYANVGAGHREALRSTIENVALPWLTKNADRLGVQLIIDYYGNQVWTAAEGWHAPKSHIVGAGQRWARYLHIEVNAEKWKVSTPIDHDKHIAPPAVVKPGPERKDGKPIQVIAPTYRKGDQGGHIAPWQAHVGTLIGKPVAADGDYGPQTAAAVEDAQRQLKLTVDGILGPQTMRALVEYTG